MDLAAIAAAFGVRFRERVAREAADTGEDDPDALLEALGISDAAFRRAVIAAARDFSIGQGDMLMLFCVPHALGDSAALRRARLALTDPRANGREVAVLDALIAGTDMEDALRRPAAAAPPQAVVVPFPRKNDLSLLNAKECAE